MQAQPDPNEVIARTLHLLSRAATVGVCKGRMHALLRHLEQIAADQTLSPAIRTTGERLLAEWTQLQAEHFGSETSAAVIH